MTTIPHLSIIVGSQNDQAVIRACLSELAAQLQALESRCRQVELIVVDGSEDGSGTIAAAEFPAIKLIQGHQAAMMPHLWRLGYEQAQGSIVAFITASCTPNPGWLARILDAPLSANGGDFVGVGGPIRPPFGRRGRDWALYFARFNAFLPPRDRDVPYVIDDVPGDNAAYDRAALQRCEEAMAGGFWETLIHVCLHRHGEELQWQPDMAVRFNPSSGLWNAAQLRRRHGRHYGATRPGSNFARRTIRLVTVPLVPFVLLGRTIRRVRSARPDWTAQLVRALPVLLVLVLAWTAGEAVGYLTGRPETF